MKLQFRRLRSPRTPRESVSTGFFKKSLSHLFCRRPFAVISKADISLFREGFFDALYRPVYLFVSDDDRRRETDRALVGLLRQYAVGDKFLDVGSGWDRELNADEEP